MYTNANKGLPRFRFVIMRDLAPHSHNFGLFAPGSKQYVYLYLYIYMYLKKITSLSGWYAVCGMRACIPPVGCGTEDQGRGFL